MRRPRDLLPFLRGCAALGPAPPAAANMLDVAASLVWCRCNPRPLPLERRRVRNVWRRLEGLQGSVDDAPLL